MKENAVKLIQSLSGKYSANQIFKDVIEMFAIAIVNACTLNQDKLWEDRENVYKSIITKYDKNEVDTIVNIISEIEQSFEEGFDDVLGYIYMSSGAGNKSTGQFFTPFHVSVLAAALSTPEDVNESKPFSMAEPSAGSGGMVIATAKVLSDRGLNYQRCLKVVAQDLDWMAVYMCYIQLSLYGIDAVVVQGDTLQDPYYPGYPRERVFRTPRNVGLLI